ncbi:MAG: hypothetical protein ACFB2W_00795 [Leptolyngbyaceae cyanobacterium]
MDVLALALLAIPGIAVVMAVSTILNGWALHLLWSWFVVPVFEALPALTIGQSIGISMVVGFLTYQYHPEPKETKGGGGAIVAVLLRPLFAVLFGLIVKQFI